MSDRLAEIKAKRDSRGSPICGMDANWLIAEVESLREGDEDVDKANKDLADEVERLGGIVTQLQENIDALWDGRFVEGMEKAAKVCEGQFGTFWADLIRIAAKEKARDGSTQRAKN